MPYLSPDECAGLHQCFLRDIKKMSDRADADIIVSYTGGEPVQLRGIFGRKAAYAEQTGADLGEKMANAMQSAFDMGYEKAVLIGTDIPELSSNTVKDAFAGLEGADVVIGPTEDGGYYLIGMKSLHKCAFNVERYGGSTVLADTVASIEHAGLSAALCDTYHDIDDKDDLAGLKYRCRAGKAGIPAHTAEYLAALSRISVIIPVYNEESTIRGMLAQLEPVRGKAEIQFVDGGSTDHTLELIGERFPVLTGAKGRAAQMNLGAESSSGDILFFLHADSVLPEGFLDEIRRCMKDHLYGCFGVRFDSRNFFMLTNRMISNHRAWRRGLPFGDQGIFIDRELFMKTGMFPLLPIMEDYEFGRRLSAEGIRPGKTRHRILTSGRRYGKGTLSILRTEYKMWALRRKYRSGADINEIARMYRDIR